MYSCWCRRIVSFKLISFMPTWRKVYSSSRQTFNEDRTFEMTVLSNTFVLPHMKSLEIYLTCWNSLNITIAQPEENCRIYQCFDAPLFCITSHTLLYQKRSISQATHPFLQFPKKTFNFSFFSLKGYKYLLLAVHLVKKLFLMSLEWGNDLQWAITANRILSDWRILW